MSYYCGLILKENKKYLVDNCINLNYFYQIYKNIPKNEITFNKFINLEEVKEILRGEFYGMYDSLFEQFLNNEYIKEYDFNKIIHFNLLFYLLFKNKNKINESLKYDFLIKNSVINENFKGKLLIRTGIVELRVINSYLYGDKQLMKDAVNNICLNYKNENYIYNQPIPNWIGIDHEQIYYESYLKASMTNAGFYFNELNVDNAIENLDFLSNEYKKAILNCDYLMYWNFLNCYCLDILNEKKKTNKIDFFLYDENSKIYDLLNNKKILLLTPFKEKIDKIYKNGNIYKLKKNRNLENIDLVTVETFLTTYPNKKHNDFKQTFKYYCEMIDYEFSNKNFDLFTCSTGCYGLLLCNYVYKKYNVTSLYIGHVINYIFGIISNRNLFDSVNIEYYEKSDLNIKYKNIEKIENNTYGSN